MAGCITSGVRKTSVYDMQIGDYITCGYHAPTSGAAGAFIPELLGSDINYSADVTDPDFAISSADYSSTYPKSYAFNNNRTNAWLSPNPCVLWWIGQDFGVGNEKKIRLLTMDMGSQASAYYPRYVNPDNIDIPFSCLYLQSSNTPDFSSLVFNFPFWWRYQATSTIQTFKIPASFTLNSTTYTNTPARYWRVYCDTPRTYYGTNRGMVSEIEMMEEAVDSEIDIPVTGSATPWGMFYFIKVDKGLLVADRNIQHSITYDTLKTAGYVNGEGMIMETPLLAYNASTTDYPNPYKDRYYSTFYPVCAIDGSDTTSFKTLYTGADMNIYGYLDWLYVFYPSTMKFTKVRLKGSTSVGENPNNVMALGGGFLYLGGFPLSTLAAGSSWISKLSPSFIEGSISLNGDAGIAAAYHWGVAEIVVGNFDIGLLSGGSSYVEGVFYEKSSVQTYIDRGWGENEWDKYMLKDRGKHKAAEVWNISSIAGSWCKNAPVLSTGAAGMAVYRNGFWDFIVCTTVSTTIGFRPVLRFEEG